MLIMDDYLEVNRLNWDERAPAHAASPGYGVDRFVADPSHLSDVVRFDLPLLGDVAGLTGIHLQCHIGTDTLSVARLGARMTGLDLSPVSLEHARRLAADAGADIDYVEADTYSAVAAVDGRTFDLVYTGIGALCWLPDIDRWAQVVASLLAPGGRLFIREGHPVLWALDWERDDDRLELAFPYFTQPEPTRWDDDGTYVAVPDGTSFTHTVSYDWNHGLGQILTAVLDAGLVIERFEEHREVPWRPFELFEPSPDHPGEFVLPEHRRERMPCTYTLVARRR
jgi:SAM-dependent methyltransferase